MAYTPNEWNTGDVITAEKLNHIEQGIDPEFLVTMTLSQDSSEKPIVTVDKTFTEIKEAESAGKKITGFLDMGDIGFNSFVSVSVPSAIMFVTLLAEDAPMVVTVLIQESGTTVQVYSLTVKENS